MKWQKLLLFLVGGGTVLGCMALLGPLLTDLHRLHRLWQALAALLWHWPGFALLTATLDPVVWWTVCAVVVIDILYLLWLRRRGRTSHFLDSAPLSARCALSAAAYEALLRQRHTALLARYQDPALAQFLLNREAARIQQLEQWVEVSEGGASTETNTTVTARPVSEQEEQRRTNHLPFALLVNPLGA